MKHLNITFLLVVLMSITVSKAFAYDIAVENADGVTIYYNYLKDKTELEVTGGGGYTDNVVIPSSVTYDGKTYPVTSIGEGAFKYCYSLTSIEIPNSVTSIGRYAFSYCSSLTSIEIPNNVTSIGDCAFSGYPDLTSIEIPNGVTSIGIGAFRYSYGLTSIEIPNSVMSIGDYAFKGCNSLTTVVVQRETPVDITSEVFTNRTNATLYVPKGCTAAYRAADYWKEFKEIKEGIPSGIKSVENNLTDKGFENGIWYTLDGRRLSGKPTKRGIYIVNGKKRVVK